MEYQKITNLLDNKSNQPTKFRTNNWVEINDNSRRTYNANSRIKFKTLMLKSILFNYSDEYILVSGTITVPNKETVTNPNSRNNIIIKNCAPFTNCISEINNTHIDIAKYIDTVMPTYNLVEYSNNYSKTSGSLWQYYRDEPFSDDNGDIADFPANNKNSALFKLKTKTAGRTGIDSPKNVKVQVL